MENVGGAGGDDANGNTRVSQHITNISYRAVATGNYNQIGAGIESCLRLRSAWLGNCGGKKGRRGVTEGCTVILNQLPNAVMMLSGRVHHAEHAGVAGCHVLPTVPMQHCFQRSTSALEGTALHIRGRVADKHDANRQVFSGNIERRL